MCSPRRKGRSTRGWVQTGRIGRATLRGVLGRVGAWDTESESESRYQCKWGSAVDGHEAMETMMGHFMEQMGEGGGGSS